ncbi:hypothetical protein [Neobacillus jeddahensis]|uniref:hypothetical protein n=1 Tax=Neobacillus jeddahensis TaxID=1461580 RepID=UPI00059163C4|nr:hypothetical protein [Neobacillus jeddahensis]
MRFFFRLFTTDRTVTKKISELEKKISVLEASLSEFKAISESCDLPSETKDHKPSPTIQIDHLQVDKIVIEHLDYANNFGQLGIKELSGKLNIGSTYEGEFTNKFNKKLEEKLKKQAKVNFKVKKES